MKQLYCIAFIMFIMFCSCDGIGKNNTGYGTFDAYKSDVSMDSLMRKYGTQKLAPRDSAYIMYTVKYWHNHAPGILSNLEQDFEMNNEDIKPYIPLVFYSPDHKKMVFILGEKMQNAHVKGDTNKLSRLVPLGADTIYEVNPMIGVREDTTAPWNLYKMPGTNTIGDTKEQADTELAKFLFVQMKHQAIRYVIQSGAHQGEVEYKEFGANVQDNDFWDKCLLWQKDTVGADNVYTFQDNVFDNLNYHPASEGPYKCFKCAVDLDYPKIDYPKEILDMYGK